MAETKFKAIIFYADDFNTTIGVEGETIFEALESAATILAREHSTHAEIISVKVVPVD
jgi:hypothetical protein